MVKYGVVDTEKLDEALTATANAIRQKTGNIEAIEWKENGMADDVNAISIGTDVSDDTVTPENLLEGIVAHNAAGEKIVGTIRKYGGEVR